MGFEKLRQIIKGMRNDIQRQSEKMEDKKSFSVTLEYERRMGGEKCI